ncbi:hypothetical protein BU56_30855 [Escherichia coli O145:H25 str. 07-3858]|nr:hypothetical protein BU56_30855 [Escherichia coli O145:H25 str. 07-3858]
MQTDVQGIRREKRQGDTARLCRRPNAQQNRIQFFELWLNSKLRHGNTVVLKIRNPRGQIKELRILDWNRVEPLVADDGDVFYRITPDRNCGITESVTVPAREVITTVLTVFFIRLWGCRGVCRRTGRHAGASYSGKFDVFFQKWRATIRRD